jgi:peptide/nickel transport system substrate-binding protein
LICHRSVGPVDPELILRRQCQKTEKPDRETKMTNEIKAAELHPAAGMYAEELKAGKISRREFLTRTTALGVSAAAAYGLMGVTAPAQAQEAKVGGIVRCAMEVKGTKDPRLADWPQIANVYRGWLEYLIQNNADGSFEGRLLESWEANADATQYTLKVRQGVTWNNGDWPRRRSNQDNARRRGGQG